jgi:AAA family ATP:ADP antiporter
VLFFFVSVLKALSYALNEPCKEMLYIPTSPLIRCVSIPPILSNLFSPEISFSPLPAPSPLPCRFKAKAWIDVFGTRVCKAFGSVVTNMAKDNPDALVKIGSVPSWMVSVILLLISIYMGRAFEKLQATHEVVGMKEAAAAGGGQVGGGGGENRGMLASEEDEFILPMSAQDFENETDGSVGSTSPPPDVRRVRQMSV